VVTYRCVLIVGCRCSVSAAWSSCYLSISESWTLRIYSSLPFSLAFGPPKCDVSHLVDLQSALCSSASVTRCYLVTFRHDILLPGRIARSQRVTTLTQVGLHAVCTLHPQSHCHSSALLQKMSFHITKPHIHPLNVYSSLPPHMTFFRH
jgi:hypothetical protein